jgi:hypothetical protein
MWGAIQHVSTGLALVAFLGAAAVVAYRAKLKHRLRIINTVPRQRRAEVITKELNAFGVDAKNLTANQQYNLAKSELNLRARRFSLYTVIAVVAIGVFGAIAIFAILLTGAALPTSMLVRNAFSQTQRIKVMPPSLGGNEVLTLDNVATLRDRAPGGGVRAAVGVRSPAGSAGFSQAAAAGSVTKGGSSRNGAMVSSVM